MDLHSIQVNPRLCKTEVIAYSLCPAQCAFAQPVPVKRTRQTVREETGCKAQRQMHRITGGTEKEDAESLHGYEANVRNHPDDLSVAPSPAAPFRVSFTHCASRIHD